MIRKPNAQYFIVDKDQVTGKFLIIWFDTEDQPTRMSELFDSQEHAIDRIETLAYFDRNSFDEEDRLDLYDNYTIDWFSFGGDTGWWINWHDSNGRPFLKDGPWISATGAGEFAKSYTRYTKNKLGARRVERPTSRQWGGYFDNPTPSNHYQPRVIKTFDQEWSEGIAQFLETK